MENTYYIIIDEYSRFPIDEVLDSTSFGQIQPILEKTFALMGIPKMVLSDNGPPFNGNAIKQFLDAYGVEDKRITPYWLEANGITERFVKTRKKSLICSQIDKNQFDSQLQQFLLNYRSTPHSTTKKSPFELVFMREINGFPPSCDKNQERDSSTKDKEQRLKHKAHADSKRKTRPNNFQIGDRVLCKIPKANTLTPRYDPEPYTVCEIKGTQIKARREDHIVVRNASFFKHFLESSTHPDISEIKTHRSNTPVPIPCTSYAEVPEDQNQEFEDQNQVSEDQDREDVSQEISLRPVRTKRRPKHLDEYMCDQNEAEEEMQCLDMFSKLYKC